MANYPVQIRRCGHIRVSGTQCGSPAIRGKEFCYYHQHDRLQSIEVHMESGRVGGEMVLPVLEDAHSIQMVVRQVMQLLLQRRIDRKDASLLLYSLQIASGNLKQMLAEKPKPTHVVVDLEKTEETPLGMTPWSDRNNGHDPEVEPALVAAVAAPCGSGSDASSKATQRKATDPVRLNYDVSGGREYATVPDGARVSENHHRGRG